MKSCSHIFALITACVVLFCGCSDYLSLSKASTISNPQTEYDTALKEYLASLETPLSTIEIKHGEDTPIVWEDAGMEAAVRLLLNRPEGTISRSDVWNLNTLTITERTMFEGDSGTTTIVTVTAQQGDACNIVGLAGCKDLVAHGLVEGLTVPEIPCHLVEAARAVVPAARNKDAGAHPRPIGNVVILDCCVIHHRCSTRSLISCVRPWFQNWVPI